MLGILRTANIGEQTALNGVILLTAHLPVSGIASEEVDIETLLSCLLIVVHSFFSTMLL